MLLTAINEKRRNTPTAFAQRNVTGARKVEGHIADASIAMRSLDDRRRPISKPRDRQRTIALHERSPYERGSENDPSRSDGLRRRGGVSGIVGPMQEHPSPGTHPGGVRVAENAADYTHTGFAL